METKFQTSFIPRKPIPTAAGVAASTTPYKPSKKSGGGGGLFMALAVLAFLASVASVAGAYFWEQYLVSSQESYRQQLTAREQQFNLSVISHLRVQSAKIALGRQIISNHVPVSQVFGVISSLTTESVAFTSMLLEAPNGISGSYRIELEGYSRGFTNIAFQAHVLNRLDQYGLNTVIRNPIISDPTPEQDGTISFVIEATIDPKAISQALMRSSQQTQ